MTEMTKRYIKIGEVFITHSVNASLNLLLPLKRNWSCQGHKGHDFRESGLNSHFLTNNPANLDTADSSTSLSIFHYVLFGLLCSFFSFKLQYWNVPGLSSWYRLNVCVHPQNFIPKANLWWDSIWRWNLWEVRGSWGCSSHD